MTAFARPPAGTSPARWWSAAARYLSPQAVHDYADTAPTAVPFTEVTGPARPAVTDAPGGALVAVEIPTDAGVYLVELIPTPTGWQVTHATPPARPGSTS